MKNPIKWAVAITQRSVDSADDFDTPVAVSVNWTFGIMTALSGLLSLLFILLSVIAEMATLGAARVTIIITIILVAAWSLGLYIIEAYLNYMDSKKKSKITNPIDMDELWQNHII